MDEGVLRGRRCGLPRLPRLFWYARRSKRSAKFLLDLALVYEVSAFDISSAPISWCSPAYGRDRRTGRPSARELCDLLGQCKVAAAWTREDAKRWWETRMTPDAAVVLVD